MSERLQKILAHAGIASRRVSEELIAAGRVTVDGVVAELGQSADPVTADIRVDGERVAADPALSYVMLNKPRGVVSTVSDPQGRPTVTQLVGLPERLHPVGRLDLDTEGLLLLTNDGELTNRLLHPSYGVRRTYLALVRGGVRRHVLSALAEGVRLDDGPARPESVRIADTHRDHTLLELVLTEGRNREVRRLLGAVGLRLERLARVAYGGVELGELRQGRWRRLTPHEIASLHAATGSGGPPPRHARVQDRRRRPS